MNAQEKKKSMSEKPKMAAEEVQAETVSIRQGGAIRVEADRVEVRQGGVVQANTKSLEITGGGLLIGQAEDARIFTSRSRVVVVRHDATMDQSGTMLQIARGDVTMEQSGTVVQIANNIKMGDNNGTVFLFAKNVEGDVRTAFGQKESIAFAIVAGITTGLVLLGGALLGRRKQK